VVFVTAVQAPIVSRLVRFFGGAAAAAGFDAARASDAALQRRVESRVPYVDALRLSGDRFVLADVELNDVGAFDVRANVRHSKTHTHRFNGPFSGTTRVSRYQKSKTNLDFTEARDSEWQSQQLGHMQVCTSLQTDNHASTPPLSFFTGRMPFLPPNQQRQSTEGKSDTRKLN